MTDTQRHDGRKANEMRAVTLQRNYTRHAEGSVLVAFGDTQVICTASVENSVPRFLKGTGKGWVTAEYGMLPRSTGTRMDREAARGKQSGRTQEIQRLIGRSLRAALNMDKLGENTIRLDCDVIQADGGTRTASITGACVALADAITVMLKKGLIKENPLEHMVASVSVGICNGQAVLDLNYEEDSTAETDMNIVMTDKNGFIEIQGTGEDGTFSIEELNIMVSLGQQGISTLFELQKQALAD